MTVQNSSAGESIKIPFGSPEGLTLSRHASNLNTTVGFAPGRAVVSHASGTDVTRFVAAITSNWSKVLTSTWVAGSGNGGRFSGSVTANTTYHVFIMRKRFTDASHTIGQVDFGFSTDPNAADAPTGWNVRMIGSILTDASSNIRAFTQVGDLFYWNPEVTDFTSTSVTTTITNLQVLTVPTGIRVIAIGTLQVYAGVGNPSAYLGSPGMGGNISAIVPSMGGYSRIPFQFLTDTLGRLSLYSSNTSLNAVLVTAGFMHPRGAW